MKHINTIWQSLLLLCLVLGTNTSLRSEIPFLNDFVTGESSASYQLFDTSEEIPFFGELQRSQRNQFHAGRLSMMDCFDVFTVGNDNSVAEFGDTITLVGTATNTDGGGTNTNFNGVWLVSDGMGGASMRGRFILPDGTSAPEFFPGTNIFLGSFAGDSDTILFLRDPADPLDGLETDFEIVFQATNSLNGSCVQQDTNLIRIDLEPNLELGIETGGTTITIIEAGATPPGDMFSTAYCNGTEIEITAGVASNPTLSGQPVFILSEVTDTSDQLGLAVLNGGVPLDGDTLFLTPNQLSLMPTLVNNSDEDIFVQLKLFPYYESDGTSTVPGTSTYDPDDDLIGDSVVFDFMVLNEPIASFGGNDTICYAADVPLDFTGTPNTRVFYRDTITGNIDSVDLDAQGRFVVTFPNVTTDLFFVIDSLVRLDPPFCTASPTTIAGIAPQPFIVTDSLVASAVAIDSIACDTIGFVSFDFVANDSASVYSFLLTNSLGTFDSTYLANGEDTLVIALDELDFDGVADTTITFYVSQLVDTTSTFNCANAALQDSFVIYVDPEPILELTFGAQVDTSDNVPTLLDTFCVTDAVSYAGVALTAANSGLPMFVCEIDSLYNLETNTVISIDTSYFAAADYNGNSTLAASGPDSLVLVRTVLPYFESESGAATITYDDDNECAGDLIRLEILLTPVPLEPMIAFDADTICADGGTDILITGGTPGASVGYDVDNVLSTVVLDVNGEATISYLPTIDSGEVIVNLQFTAATCTDLISGADTLFVTPLPTGFLTVASDSVCQNDEVHVIFNTNTTFDDEFNVRLWVRDTNFNTAEPNVNANLMDGDTIYSGNLTEDRVFIIRRVRYLGVFDERCPQFNLDTIFVRVENEPALEIDFTEISVSPDMSTTAVDPDSVFFEVCAGDSLYLDYRLPTIADTSRFNDSVFVALFINDPLGVTPAGAGSSMVMLDIDEMTGYDSLHLVNNTNDTARIEIIAIPFFTGTDGVGNPTTPFADACKGDSIEIQIDVINNFVTTIGGNYEVCFGADTVVVITGPDLAEVDYVTITDNGMGGLDTSSLITIQLDNQGRFEIVIDSILQDTTYDLIEARLPGSGCPANLGPNITVEVIPPPTVDFVMDSLTVCEGLPFGIELENGPANAVARIYDSLGIDTFRITLDGSGAFTINQDSILTSRKYYVDSIVFSNQMGLFCPTDTITDSLYVTVLPAPRLAITTDTVCFGDTAYVTLVTASADSFNLTVDSAGVGIPVNGVVAGDTILAINGITQDSLRVILESGFATNGNMCTAFPTTQFLDTAYLRVDTLPQGTVQFTEPLDLTVTAATSPDTLIVCDGTVLTNTITSTPATNIAGYGFAINTTITSSDGTTTNSVITNAPLSPEDLELTMITLPAIFSPDSTIFTVTGIPYFPSDTFPDGSPLPLDPVTDCAGDTVTFTIVILPTPIASFTFGQDTICEDETTTVQITGNPGDTVLFGVEGFGTTTIVLPSPTGVFDYQMPTVAQFDSASLATTFPPVADDNLVFAILNVSSGTEPSCINNTALFDTIAVERLPDVTASILEDSVCFGGTATVELTDGTPGATAYFTLDYLNQTDASVSALIDGSGNASFNISPLTDTVTIVLDSLISGSSSACEKFPNDTLGQIVTIPLPTGILVADTVCNGDSFDVVFVYTGDRMVTALDSFTLSGTQPSGTGMGMNVPFVNSRVRSDSIIDTETYGPGTYTYTISSITDNTTGCTSNFSPVLEFTFVVEENPAFSIAYTGTVENGQTYDTEVPIIFPAQNTVISNVCSGSDLVTNIVSSSTSSMGDPTHVRVTVFEDDFGLFGGLASPIDTTLSFLEFNQVLNNNTDVTATVSYRVQPYFETDATNGLDADECTGNEYTFVINVFPNPMAEFTNMDTMRICSGDSIFLKFDGSIGAEVDFEDDDGNTYPTSIIGANDSVKYVANQAGPDTVQFFITNVEQTFPGINQVCTGTSMDTVVLIVNPLPTPFLEFMANDTICFNETVEVVFRDLVGTGPWTVEVNGIEYNVLEDGDTIFTSDPLSADTGFTISATTDGNGCVADTISSGVVYTDTVRVDEVPLLTTDLEIFDFVNISQGTDQLVDGLLELDTFCSLQRLEFAGSSTTPTSLSSDPLYVQVEITGDVSTIWNGIYTGDTTFVVPLADIPAELNTPLIPNNTASTLAAQIILTPYFETDISMPGLGMDECGGAMDTLRIFIDPRPNAANNLLEFEICSGDTFQFDLNTNITNLQMGTTYSYLVSSTGATTAPDRITPSGDIIDDVLTNISTSEDTVTYLITPFSPGGCEGDEFEIDVIVQPEPVLVANAISVCSREESSLEVTRDFGAINPNRYVVADVRFNADSLTAIDVIAIGDTFNRAQTVNNGNGNDNRFIRDEFENLSFGSQTVEYDLVPFRNQTGCSGDTVTFTISVDPEPLVMDQEITICTDTRLNVDLQDYVLNGLTSDFTWETVFIDPFVDGATFVTQNSNILNDSLRLLTSAGTQQRIVVYRVTVAGNNGCPAGPPNEFELTVRISPNIQLSTSTPDGDFICSGDPDGLDIVATAANTIGNVNYNWSIGSVDPGVINPVIIDPTGNGSTINVNATGNGQFTVLLEVDDEGGCTAMSSTTITVFGELVPDFDTTYVGGVNTATVDFTDTSVGFPTAWLWTFDDPASGSSDTSMVQNPTHTFTSPGTYDVTLRVIRQAFCPDTATVVKQVFIGFTPEQRCDTVILYPGFNVISLDVDSTDNSPAAIFQEIQDFQSAPGNSNLNQVIGVHPDQSPSPLIFTEFFQTLTSIRPGFGYVVNVDVQDTLIVCGTSIDPNLRVDLQAGFNVVGYVNQNPTTINSYFDSIITDGNMSSIQTYDMGSQFVWTPFFATLNDVKNGQGYVLDVSAAYTGNQWREDNYTSSNFEYVYGTTSLGNDFAYYPVEVVDEFGTVLTTFNLDADGNFGPAFLFGIVQDINSHETFGIPQGTELRFRIGDQLSTTTHVFQGGWLGSELNIEFESVVSSVIDQFETVRFQVYPNPARQLANLSFTTETSISSLRVDIINATGRMVGSRILENVTGTQTLDLNVRDLPAGVYLVRLTGDGNFLGSDQLIIRR